MPIIKLLTASQSSAIKNKGNQGRQTVAYNLKRYTWMTGNVFVTHASVNITSSRTQALGEANINRKYGIDTISLDEEFSFWKRCVPFLNALYGLICIYLVPYNSFGFGMFWFLFEEARTASVCCAQRHRSIFDHGIIMYFLMFCHQDWVELQTKGTYMYLTH